MPEPVRLLWVDSDDQAIASGRPVLTRQGWNVEHARTLVEALDRITKSPYDVVIFELQLPDALGTDAWVSIKRLRPKIIGIMTTHSSSLLALVRVDSPGIVAYLPKPLDMNAVSKIIAEALADSGGTDFSALN